jgi:5'-3' exonuclease
MGIERFFSAINRNFNVVSLVSLIDEKNIECDTFLIDFNSIIHNISSKLTTIKSDDLDENIILEVKNYLDSLLKKVKCNLVYIAIDGVPTFSKILEQKKRRFIGGLIEQLTSSYKTQFSFNKNLISPGTTFMDKLCNYLNSQDFSVKVIISDSNEPGEGEFKILDYVLNNKLNNIIIYSPDADLIILSMIIWLPTSKINILRYDQNTQVLNIIYINQLVNYMLYYFEDKVENKIDHKKYILDLCFIFTVFGNDFLPKLEDINTNMDLYLILDAYIINYVDYGYILNDDIDIIPQTFHNYLQFISKYENFLLRRNAGLYKYQNYNYANTINLYLDIQNKKYNPSMIFYFDFGKSLNKKDKYGKLSYYLVGDITKLSYDYKNNFNQKYIESHVKYQKFIPFEYNSNNKKHIIAMNKLEPRDKELYLINNKLDKYYHLFNPNNIFYNSFNKKDYYKSNKIKDIVNEYLKGLKWLINYYFKRDFIDETWYYPFHISPLLSDLVLYFNPQILNYTFKSTNLNITPIEQLLYITPIQSSNINKFIEIINIDNKEKINITQFIKNKPSLFYNLDELYIKLKSGELKNNLMDCSTATFISKCNYHILDKIQPIKLYKLT